MNDFKAAARSLLAAPAATVAVVVTLAIAIGANTAIFSVVSGVLLRPLGYGDDSRLVVLWAVGSSGETEKFRLSPADYRDVREEARSFDGQVALYRFIGSTFTGLAGRDSPVRVGSLAVTTRLFEVLSQKPELGSFFSDEDEKPGGPRKVVLSHASWARRFGSDPSIVGSPIELDGQRYTVLGVTQPGFQFPPGNDEVEMYFPMALSDAILLDRNHRMFDAVARLSDESTLASAEAELATLAERLSREFPDTNEGWGLVVEPLREELFGELRKTLAVLSGAVLLVLLIACVNVANVLAARSVASSRELAVRCALGARTRNLFHRSWAESSLLGLFGGGLGLLLAYWGVRLLRSFLPAEIPRIATIGIDESVLAFALFSSLGATLIFGALPALRSLAPDLMGLLKPTSGFGAGTGGERRLSEILVVVQVALAIVLLVGAGLMVKSFARLSEVSPGFRRDGVVSVAVALPGNRHSREEARPFFEDLVERVRRLPWVRAAGAVSDLPMSDVGLALQLEFTLPGLEASSPTARPNADLRLILPGYFDAMGMRIVNGRDFDGLDATSDRRVAIVNETLVRRYFHEGHPSGQTIEPLGRSLRLPMFGEIDIVGVVSDIRHRGLTSKYESEIYLPYGRITTMEMNVVVQSDLDKSAVASAVGELLRERDPDLVPSRVAALSDLLWESAAEPRFNTALLSGLALAAALLAVVGTYGIVAYSVSTRRGEIGLRMALGADASDAVRLIVRGALGIVGVGVLLGLLGAFLLTRLMTGLLFEVEPTDPVTFGAVLVAAIIAGSLAAFWPARKATRIDPVAALRGD